MVKSTPDSTPEARGHDGGNLRRGSSRARTARPHLSTFAGGTRPARVCELLAEGGIASATHGWRPNAVLGNAPAGSRTRYGDDRIEVAQFCRSRAPSLLVVALPAFCDGASPTTLRLGSRVQLVVPLQFAPGDRDLLSHYVSSGPPPLRLAGGGGGLLQLEEKRVSLRRADVVHGVLLRLPPHDLASLHLVLEAHRVHVRRDLNRVLSHRCLLALAIEKEE